jgi:xanthine dehydrogenase accessory factor
MMLDIYAELEKILAAGKKAVLARIIRQEGSAPRATGTNLLILEDCSIVGTIGGGAFEFRVIDKAKEVFRDGKSAILHFQLTGDDVAQTEMLCGGIVDVYLEPVYPQNPSVLSVIKKINELLDCGQQGTLITLVSEDLGFDSNSARMLIAADGAITGSIEEQPGSIATGIDQWRNVSNPTLHETEMEGCAIFAEPIAPAHMLYLFGAGHISMFVAPLAKLVGFRICVIDDRKEFANASRFPSADEIVVGSFSDAFKKIAITSSSYLAIITRGHIHDHDVLKASLQTKAAYIGMIGSLRKRKMIYQSLIEEGSDKEKLKHVHSPIGIDIGAQTPEEIAISIVAELVQIRAHRAVTKPSLED